MTSNELIQLIGFLPAIIFPLASLSQLMAMYRRQSSEGVSVLTWTMVAIANVCLYVYTQKYGEIQSIAALLGAAFLNAWVAIYAFYLRRLTRSSQV